MNWGKEVVRACLSGVLVNFAIVGACSAGGSGSLKSSSRDPDTGGSGGSVDVTGRRTAAGGSGDVSNAGDPSIDGGSGPRSDEMIPVMEARAAESGTRLKARWYIGADGSRQFISWFDNEAQRECYFAVASDGVLRCLPTFPSFSAFFLDSACAQPIAWSLGCSDIESGETISIGFAVYDPVCQDQVLRYESRFFAIGPAAQPAQLWQKGPDGCIAAGVFATGTYRQLGAEIPASSFVSAQVQIDP